MTYLDALKKLGIVLATVIIAALPVSPANADFSYTDLCDVSPYGTN